MWLSLCVFLNAIHIVGLQGQGIISEKNQAKITRNAEREAKYYLKKGYQVYDSTEDLENSLRSYYRYKFSENETGNRIYVVPISMSREKNLEDAVSSARLKSGQSTLGLMQLYFNSWIRTDERTSENEKELLINAVEKAESGIRKMYERTPPVQVYIFYKKNKKDYRVEIRSVHDQELLREISRKQIISKLEPNELFEGKDLNEILVFEK